MKTICFLSLFIVLCLLDYFISHNNKIVFELDKPYFNLNDLKKAAIKHLEKEGRHCKIVDNSTFLIDGKKYSLSMRFLNFITPIQQIVLIKIN